MRITWIGHSTVLITTSQERLLTDPVLTRRIGPLRRRGPVIDSDWLTALDAVLISHGHRDHLHAPSLRLIDHETRVIAPRGMQKVINRLGFRSIASVEPTQHVALKKSKVHAVQVKHSGFRPPFGPTGTALGFLIVNELDSIFFAGDTGLFDGLEDMAGKVNVALLPVGGWGLTLRGGHLDPKTAVKAVEMMKPDCVIPVHWGTLWPYGLGRFRRAMFSEPATEFKRLVNRRLPQVDVLVLSPGETATI